MFTPRKNSLPSPSLEDSFFPLSSTTSVALSLAVPSSISSPGSIDSGGGLETDLILAAELGQALLEKNEELAASLEQREREVEALQQEKHVLQRKLEMNELASGQREAELTADLAALRAELERHHSQGQERRRDESQQLTQLANHNQRLVEQLAENRVLQGRLSHIEAQLKASQEDTDRLRVEREALRERASELQIKLREKEAEAKEALLAHSTVLQARDEEIQALKEELKSQQEELESLRKEITPFSSSDGKPSYSFLESELAAVRQEKESLTQQLLNTIKHKVALSQELDAWQEDMRLVINEQVQQNEERRKERQKDNSGLQRSKSLKVKGEGGKGFFSFFKEKK
ncbi:BICD family-like cargo adapter 2 Bicaudal D-related protein 2 [Channa argus]|uniref:BICD family-like cargo adapter 2 n=1 Tax=Channa argus TaxID=215402 RepID=A0A6G1QW29_CHAAH|nr:BICD family-like cargo adapter 2 Bicaudal D-related protein 2 [Channa argus]